MAILHLDQVAVVKVATDYPRRSLAAHTQVVVVEVRYILAPQLQVMAVQVDQVAVVQVVRGEQV